MKGMKYGVFMVLTSFAAAIWMVVRSVAEDGGLKALWYGVVTFCAVLFILGGGGEV